MNVIKCLNGHFYDADKYQTCPHCGASAGSVAPKINTEEKKEHTGVFGKKKPAAEVEMQKVPDQTIGKTFGIFNESEKEKPAAFSTEERKCPNCGADLSAIAKFCKACGSKVELAQAKKEEPAPATDVSSKKSVFDISSNSDNQAANNGMKKCPNCGADIALTAKFCKACGTKIETATNVVEEKTPIEADIPEIAETDNQVLSSAFDTVDSVDEEPTIKEAVVETPIDEEPAKKSSLQEQIRNAAANSDGKTVGFFSTGDDEDSCDPVVGWLVCLKGNHLGESFNIVSGRNAVGRGISNKIVLSKDNTVSREKHAWITYDPKHRVFYIQPGESSGLSYLNGETLMESKKMAAKDMVEFGNGTYMLVPLCGDDFSWEEYIKE